MKKSIFVYFLSFLSYTSFSQETIAIPDIGLEECLIDLNIDSNGLNGSILVSDAKYVVNLNINNPITNKLLPNVHSKIKDLTGLESFPNLKRLDCFDNDISKIDLSKSTSITFLNCNDNKIERLNLSNNTQLTYVSCDNNKLQELIIGNNPNLESLYCNYNKLTTLNIENCTSLESLDTSGNRITNIVVNTNQLSSIPEGWYKDEETIYISNSDLINPPLKITNTKPVTKTTVFDESFKRKIVLEFEKNILTKEYLNIKKKELLKRYKNLTDKDISEWIKKYSKLNFL